MLLILQKGEGSFDDYREPVDSVWDIPRDTLHVCNEYTQWIFDHLNEELKPQYELKKNSYNDELQIHPINYRHNPRRNKLFFALKEQYSIPWWLENVVGGKKLSFTSYIDWKS